MEIFNVKGSAAQEAMAGLLRGCDNFSYPGVTPAAQHHPPIHVTPTAHDASAAADLYGKLQPDTDWDNLNAVVGAMARVITCQPHAVDMAYGSNNSGRTARDPMFCASTRWLCVAGTGVYLRLSRARTARHITGLLRTPIDGNGLALEATRNNSDGNPGDIVTLLVFQPRRWHDSRYPLLEARDAQVFDLRQFNPPLSAVLSGFPNRLTAAVALRDTIAVMREVAMGTLEAAMPPE